MKRLFYFCLAAILAACNVEDENLIEKGKTAQLAISTEIVTTRAYFNTGLKNDIEFTNGNQIGFTLVDNYDCPINKENYNIKAVYDNGQWSPEKTTPLSDKEGKVIAYYPYCTEYQIFLSPGSPGPTTGQHSIPVDISSFAHGDGQQEYLCGESNIVSSVSPNARIKFRHVLPRITFVLEKGSTNANDDIYLRSAILKNATDAGNTICTKGTMYIGNGSVSKNNDKGGSITNSYGAPILLDPASEQRTFDFLVLPTEVEKGSVIMRIEARKGSTGNFQYYDILIPTTKWESGKQYTYPVTLNIKESQQESKETPGEKVYMGFNGDNGKPLYWSSWNLGAMKVEDYGGYYAWGEKVNKSNYSWSTYTHCSGTSDTYHSIGNEISGTQYDAARQLWGDNWRIPSRSELKSLMDNCNTTWTTINGIYGVRFTSKKNNNNIFLPAAGYYSFSGNSSIGEIANYASSSIYIYEGSKENVWEMWIQKEKYPTPTFAAGSVINGRSIRPVTE